MNTAEFRNLEIKTQLKENYVENHLAVLHYQYLLLFQVLSLGLFGAFATSWKCHPFPVDISWSKKV